MVQRSGAMALQVASVPARAAVAAAGVVIYAMPPLRLNCIGWIVAACGVRIRQTLAQTPALSCIPAEMQHHS